MLGGEPVELLSRCRGVLVGGAVGDALGAPYEGLWGHTIPGRSELLAGFGEFEGYPRGQYTDDTQLTLATVESVLIEGALDVAAIARRIAALWAHDAVIGPGGACTRAAWALLRGEGVETCGAPVGQAGNGAAMRTAPLGLFAKVEEVARVSRITHQDPRSVAGGVAVAEVVASARRGVLEPAAVCARLAEVLAPYHAEFAGWVGALPGRAQEPGVVAWLAAVGQADYEFEAPIVTPFVVPTVLASLLAVCRFPGSWEDAVAEAIGFGGDVDTTGAITGAIQGARLGVEAIPRWLVEGVVDAERIEGLAARLHGWIVRR